MSAKNVLLIVVDQWRGDTLPMLGHELIQTPNVAALAAEGVTFARHYTQTIPCGPARVSLHTGRYSMNHRSVQNGIPLAAGHTNLALEARRLGYDPVLVGYSSTTPDPRGRSADDPAFKAMSSLLDGWRSVGAWGPLKEAYFGWVANHGYDLPDNPSDIWLPETVGPEDIGATAKPSRIPAELTDTAFFTEKALEFLKAPRKGPWFLHLGYFRPHPPFSAPAPFNAMYRPEDCPPPLRASSKAAEGNQHPLLDYYIGHETRSHFFENGQGLVSDMSEAEVQQTRATYYGLISEIDQQLGRVFDFLKETGQWEDTLIVFTGDHGEQLGDHHLMGKLGYFDQSYHIPLVIRDPRPEADATRGTLVGKFTEIVDIMPTVLDWVDAPVPRACDGYSLLDFLHRQEGPAAWRTEVHYEYDFRNTPYARPEEALGLAMDDCSLAVVQDEHYKYVHFAALPPLFFDLREDPGQFHNCAEDPAYAGRMLTYARKMLDWRLRYADRTITGYMGTSAGLVVRP